MRTVPVSGSVARHAATHTRPGHDGAVAPRSCARFAASNVRVSPGAIVKSTEALTTTVAPPEIAGSVGMGGSEATNDGVGVDDGSSSPPKRLTRNRRRSAGLWDDRGVTDRLVACGVWLVRLRVPGRVGTQRYETVTHGGRRASPAVDAAADSGPSEAGDDGCPSQRHPCHGHTCSSPGPRLAISPHASAAEQSLSNGPKNS